MIYFYFGIMILECQPSKTSPALYLTHEEASAVANKLLERGIACRVIKVSATLENVPEHEGVNW